MTTVDFPCTYNFPIDGVTYEPWATMGDGDDWNPFQTEGIATNWGYIVPDTENLSTPAVLGANLWDDEGWLVDRSHTSSGADFDPARSIGLSLSNPGIYGPPIGVIEPDGSITFNSDPNDPLVGHWDNDGEALYVRFEGDPPTSVSLTNYEFVVHAFGGGNTPRLWIDWVNDDGQHRAAYIPLRNTAPATYAWLEDAAPLPADFPIDRVLAGDQFMVHFTIYGGFYYGMFAYMAFRFEALTSIDARSQTFKANMFEGRH